VTKDGNVEILQDLNVQGKISGPGGITTVDSLIVLGKVTIIDSLVVKSSVRFEDSVRILGRLKIGTNSMEIGTSPIGTTDEITSNAGIVNFGNTNPPFSNFTL